MSTFPKHKSFDQEYSLKKSKEAIGALVPILKSATGEVIDGVHRKVIDPDWPSITLKYIDTDAKFTMARIVANWARREMSAVEKHEGLSLLAKLTGWTPVELAENTGLSYRTVMRYLAPEYKLRPHTEVVASVAIAECKTFEQVQMPPHNPQNLPRCPFCGRKLSTRYKDPEKFRDLIADINQKLLDYGGLKNLFIHELGGQTTLDEP